MSRKQPVWQCFLVMVHLSLLMPIYLCFKFSSDNNVQLLRIDPLIYFCCHNISVNQSVLLCHWSCVLKNTGHSKRWLQVLSAGWGWAICLIHWHPQKLINPSQLMFSLIVRPADIRPAMLVFRFNWHLEHVMWTMICGLIEIAHLFSHQSTGLDMFLYVLNIPCWQTDCGENTFYSSSFSPTLFALELFTVQTLHLNSNRPFSFNWNFPTVCS